MATQWPLVIFTFFVCLTSGLLGAESILALQGKGKATYFPAIIVSAVSLVVGGLGAFMHLQHWERIFNGFGHITSGITQELIGCVALAIIIVLWVLALRGKGASKGLAVATIIVAIAMVVATAHSYLMPGRPAWGVGLVMFYLANACLLGAVCAWALAACTGDEEASVASAKLTGIGGALQVVANAVYLALLTGSSVHDFGHYANPTLMTTHPTHIDSLLNFAVAGEGAVMCWLGIVCAAVACACGFAAARKQGSQKTFMVVAAIAAIAASFTFRVLIYQLGFSVTMLY